MEGRIFVCFEFGRCLCGHPICFELNLLLPLSAASMGDSDQEAVTLPWWVETTEHEWKPPPRRRPSCFLVDLSLLLKCCNILASTWLISSVALLKINVSFFPHWFKELKRWKKNDVIQINLNHLKTSSQRISHNAGATLCNNNHISPAVLAFDVKFQNVKCIYACLNITQATLNAQAC